MAETASLIENVVVLGGNGAMGSLFCMRLSDQGKQVVAIDLQTTSSLHADNFQYLNSDVRMLDGESQNALSRADLVIAALPESVMMSAWQEITRYQKPASLLVDTLSVKTPIVKALSHSKSPDEIVSINPMFAPSLGFSDQSVVLIDIRHGPIADTLVTMMETWGCRLVILSAEQHDRYTAMLQTVTHAAILTFGTALQRLGYDISTVERFMPPPHRTLLALVARILSADPEVYWSIQSSNPYAKEIRHVLASAIKEFSDLIDNQNQADFEAHLISLTTLFNPEQLQKYQQICSQIFTDLTSKNM